MIMKTGNPDNNENRKKLMTMKTEKTDDNENRKN